MRIAIDLTSLLPQPTGVDNYLKQLVLNLSKIDHENQYMILINYEDRNVFQGMLPRNFTAIALCLRPRAVRLLFQQIILPVAAMGWNADVVHSPSFIMPLYRGGQRHVVTIHDMTFFSLPECHITLRRSSSYKRAVLWSIRRAHLVIAPSQSTKQHILDVIPDMAPDQIRVIPQGIGEEFRVYPEAEARRELSRLCLPSPYILYVGTIEPRKNLQRLVESYRTLLTKERLSEHLVLAGRLGWGYGELMQQLGSPELRGKVHLLGYVAQSDLPWLYAGARLFVYPSLQEGFGFPPLEAMACGVPTISSLSSSLAENLQGAAELVPPDDEDGLTAAMHQLLYDDVRRAKYRQEGLARIAKFRWEQTAQDTLNCYRDVGCSEELPASHARS